MPRIRFGLRWMILAVAIVGFLLEGWIVWRRYTFCRDRAAMLSRNAAGLRRVAAPFPPGGIVRGLLLAYGDGRPDVRATRESALVRAAFYDALARRYEFAARRPWLPVKPDPPEPE